VAAVNAVEATVFAFTTRIKSDIPGSVDQCSRCNRMLMNTGSLTATATMRPCLNWTTSAGGIRKSNRRRNAPHIAAHTVAAQ
jgi:hypothetical protein